MIKNKYLEDLLVHQIITEKTNAMVSSNKFAFKVRKEANKDTVKKIVEEFFKVEVVSVNMLNIKGKQKRFRGKIGFRKDFKKAIVTLKDGSSVKQIMGD